MGQQTTTQRLATALLGEPVLDWIRARRPEMTWRRIGRELLAATNGEIDVTEATLIGWAADAEDAERATA